MKVTDKRNMSKQQITEFPDCVFLNQSYCSEINYPQTTDTGTWNSTEQEQIQKIFRLLGAILFWLLTRHQKPKPICQVNQDSVCHFTGRCQYVCGQSYLQQTFTRGSHKALLSLLLQNIPSGLSLPCSLLVTGSWGRFSSFQQPFQLFSEINWQVLPCCGLVMAIAF